MLQRQHALGHIELLLSCFSEIATIRYEMDSRAMRADSTPSGVGTVFHVHLKVLIQKIALKPALSFFRHGHQGAILDNRKAQQGAGKRAMFGTKIDKKKVFTTLVFQCKRKFGHTWLDIKKNSARISLQLGRSQLNWIEQRISNPQVTGSSPVGRNDCGLFYTAVVTIAARSFPYSFQWLLVNVNSCQ